MKKVLVMAALAALVSTSAFALIAGSKHDMVTAGFVTGTTETCVFCHTPHAANTAVTLAPLWNRDTINATGNIYNTATDNLNNATLASINGTDAPLCLSCHDGLVGTSLQNPPNGVTLAVGANTMNANAIITTGAGADLANDHPVGMDLGAAFGVLDGGGIDSLANIQTAMGGANPFFGTNNTMWCSSCHDVHGATGVSTFLIINNNASALCLACHVK